MDITLLPDGQATTYRRYTFGFNPCFNGYYTFTTRQYKKRRWDYKVSILVLMDITLLLEKSNSYITEEQ